MLDIKKLLVHLLKAAECQYPIGFYLWTSESPQDYDPNNEIGGTWELMDEGLTLVSAGVTYTIQSGTSKDGGSKDAIIPYHYHSVNEVGIGSSGGHTHTVQSAGDDSAKLTGSNPTDVKAVWRTPGTSAGSNKLTGNGAHGHTVPSHNTNYSGESVIDKNMMPYKAAYCWHRTA